MQFKFTDPCTDFSNGLSVLLTYHTDLIKKGLQLLELAETIRKHGVDQDSAYRAIELHAYYSRANQLHHQDEERAVFPVIVERSDLIDGMMERLLLDHEEIELAWHAVAELLKNPEQITDGNQLMALATKFERMQREHLTRENEDFLPLISTLISTEEDTEMGKKMSAMRHLN